MAKRGIKLDMSITNDDADNEYFMKMNSTIPKALDEFRPDFILYNAGTDCMENDPLGSKTFQNLCRIITFDLLKYLYFLDLNLTPKGIIKRDELIFEYALSRKIPILMVLSGK